MKHPFDFNGDGKVDFTEQIIAYNAYSSCNNENETYSYTDNIDAMSDFDADGVYVGDSDSDGSYYTYTPQSNYNYTKPDNIIDEAFMKLQNDADNSPVPPEQAGSVIGGSFLVIAMLVGAVVLSVIVHNDAFTVVALLGTPFLACAIFNMIQKAQ